MFEDYSGISHHAGIDTNPENPHNPVIPPLVPDFWHANKDCLQQVVELIDADPGQARQYLVQGLVTHGVEFLNSWPELVVYYKYKLYSADSFQKGDIFNVLLERSQKIKNFLRSVEQEYRESVHANSILTLVVDAYTQNQEALYSPAFTEIAKGVYVYNFSEDPSHPDYRVSTVQTHDLAAKLKSQFDQNGGALFLGADLLDSAVLPEEIREALSNTEFTSPDDLNSAFPVKLAGIFLDDTNHVRTNQRTEGFYLASTLQYESVKDSISEILGNDISDYSLPEQMAYLRVLQNIHPNEIPVVQKCINIIGADSFMSSVLYSHESVATTLQYIRACSTISLDTALGQAQLDLIQKVGQITHTLAEYDMYPPESFVTDTSTRSENLSRVWKAARSVIFNHAANRIDQVILLLSQDTSDNSAHEIESLLRTLNIDVISTAALVSEISRDPDISVEVVQKLHVGCVPMAELRKHTNVTDKMKFIYDKNCDKNKYSPELKYELLKGFEESLQKDTSFVYTLLISDDVYGFVIYDDNSDGTFTAKGLNIDEGIGGYRLGELLVIGSLKHEAQNRSLQAQCLLDKQITTRYITDVGFVGTGIDSDGVMNIEANIQKYHTLKSRSMSLDEIAGSQHPGIVCRQIGSLANPDINTLALPEFASGKVLSRFERYADGWVLVFEEVGSEL